MSLPPEDAANTSNAVAAGVAVKLPEFWKNDPAMWFAQAEAQFALANVVRDDTIFYYIIAKVDQSVICHIADLVTAPPTNDKYLAVKQRLISRFQLSAEGRLERLLNACDLGDMRPTQLFAKMTELAPGLNVTNELLKMLFLQRMPPNVKAILTISDGTTGKLAEMADKMMEYPTHQVSATAATGRDNISDLRNQIAALTAEIRNLKASGGSARSRSASKTRRLSSPEDEVCWFHRKYGGRALKCHEPCRFGNPKN